MHVLCLGTAVVGTVARKGARVANVRKSVDDLPQGVLIPRHGVYITRVCLPDGRTCPGITNVGVRPTVSQSGLVTVETFLLDFDGNLYDQHLRLEFFRHLRDEQRFADAEALKTQIHKDIASARAYFAKTDR